MVVEFITLTDRALVPPKVTDVAPVKFVPVIVTTVPPEVEPEIGLKEVAVGAAEPTNVYAPPAVPPGVVTVRTANPADFAGATTVSWVAELTVNAVAGVPPKLTEDVLSKLVPVTITVLPPLTGPVFGLIVVIAGTGTAT